MTEERRQITGHILACGTQIMWGATFVSTKVLLNYFLPAEVLFTRAVLAFLALLIFYPHHLHVFKGYLSHEFIRQTWLVLGLEAQSYVPHRLLNPWI